MKFSFGDEEEDILFNKALEAMKESSVNTISLNENNNNNAGVQNNKLKTEHLMVLKNIRIDAGLTADDLYISDKPSTSSVKTRRPTVLTTLNAGFKIEEYNDDVPNGVNIKRKDGLMADKKQVGPETIVMSTTKKEKLLASMDYSKKQKKRMEVKTTGPKWFDMPAPEITPELKRDLQVLKMRSALDKKQHYKKGTLDKNKQFKYFQVGTIVEDKTHYYSSRLTKKQRKQNLVDQYLL